MTEAPKIEWLAQELLGLLGTDRQVVPFSHRYLHFDLWHAYEIVSRVDDLRRARGESPVGRKIGFTNRSIWGDLGISAPVWNFIYDSTVRSGQSRFLMTGMPEPRIEPELVLHLAKSPALGMTTSDLFECVDWVAPGFEVVYSIFPNWVFSAADAAAAYGVHGALFIGGKLDVGRSRAVRLAEVSSFIVELKSDRGSSRVGHAHDVLGGPLEALKYLVEEIARYPSCQPLRAGELVTTGTLTEAMPARSGETWTVRFQGINLTPLQLGFD